MENSISIDNLKIGNNKLNPTGLVLLALEKLGAMTSDKDFGKFLSDELEDYFTVGELAKNYYPFVLEAHGNDHVLMINDEWFLIPWKYWDDCPYGDEDTKENVAFWENLLSKYLEKPVKIIYSID